MRLTNTQAHVEELQGSVVDRGDAGHQVERLTDVPEIEPSIVRRLFGAERRDVGPIDEDRAGVRLEQRADDREQLP